MFIVYVPVCNGFVNVCPFSPLWALVHIYLGPNKCFMCVCMIVGVRAPVCVCFLSFISLIARQGVPPENTSPNNEVQGLGSK